MCFCALTGLDDIAEGVIIFWALLCSVKEITRSNCTLPQLRVIREASGCTLNSLEAGNAKSYTHTTRKH